MLLTNVLFESIMLCLLHIMLRHDNSYPNRHVTVCLDVCIIIENKSLPENHKVLTTKMQLFRRAHFVITFPISFYAHVHILCQLEQNNRKTTFSFMISNTLCKNYHKQHSVLYTAASSNNSY